MQNLILKFTIPLHRNGELCHYEEAYVDHMRRAIKEFSWERSFANNCINEKFMYETVNSR